MVSINLLKNVLKDWMNIEPKMALTLSLVKMMMMKTTNQKEDNKEISLKNKVEAQKKNNHNNQSILAEPEYLSQLREVSMPHTFQKKI